ncbi:MAG: tetratricopeptide repeat protein [Acidobacteria bacterium]|nr:tetratricopeptide repeat protein [Acidobacteriota bacterium]MYE06132.1 tetratricopeptide repeat protein [Chloroflexota bacterium]
MATTHTVAVALVATMTVPSLSLGQQLTWLELTERLERAALAGSGQELRAVRMDLLRQLIHPAEQAPGGSLLEYAIAYAGWRLANLSEVPNREQADFLDDAVERLETLVNVDPECAEAQALLGSLYGLQIGREPSRGAVLGVRASAALDRAAAAAPDSPRVPLLQGISAFHKPARFGGGLDSAERLLRHSLDLFSREPPDQPWPNWGRFDAHAWLGQTLARRNDPSGARAEYEAALSLAPDSGWVKFVLLPALNGAGRR